MKESLTVVITAYNEEKNITACIESAKLLCENIIVFDTQSTDNTVSLAKKMGVEVVTLPYGRIVEGVRKKSIELAPGPWVFLLDADERITRELANEIKEIIKNTKFSNFKIKRKNLFGQTWLRHGNWWPDIIEGRLINKKFFVNWSTAIHSSPIIKGQSSTLNSPLRHYSQGNLTMMVNKTAIFEDIESDLLLKAGRNADTLTFFRKFIGELYRRLVRGLGFLDGQMGTIAAIYQAYSKTITYLMLYEKEKNRHL